MDVRYPQVEVSLVGEDGNAFAIIGRVTRALKEADVPASERAEFSRACFNAGSYDELLQLVMQTVEVS